MYQLHTENAMLKEHIGSIANGGGNAGGEALKKQVAALELKVNDNAAFASEETSKNLEKIESNVAGIDSNAASITANAAGIGSNAGLVQSNTKQIASNAVTIQANADGIANQTVALANVTASILNIIGSDIDAAVALEVPIVVARSLGNITLALQAVQTLLVEKVSSAELVFELVGFAFPASAKPDKEGNPPLDQCYGKGQRGFKTKCCLVGGRTVFAEGSGAIVPCGSPLAVTPLCPLFCNATITCPKGSTPVATGCMGISMRTSPNVTILANGLHKVTCVDPQYMANIADLGAESNYDLDNRMTTTCVSLKTSTKSTNTSSMDIK